MIMAYRSVWFAKTEESMDEEELSQPEI